MKKFVNDPAKFVPEMLEGILLANEGMLKYEPKYNLIYRADRPQKDKVSVIQGSGSGHEPAHVMAVGPGMLDAASPGNVFAAPREVAVEPRWTAARVLAVRYYHGARVAILTGARGVTVTLDPSPPAPMPSYPMRMGQAPNEEP